MYFAGIDVGGTAAKLGVLDESGQILFRDSVKTGKESPETVADRIAESLAKFPHKIDAAGISCAGSVNLQTRRVEAGNLDWWDVPFAEIMETRLGCPVAIDNDVAGALIGEWKHGACRGKNNVVFLTLGTGVGGALLINGQPYRGFDNTGGELGHIVTHADGLPCTCGGRGCLEQYASATALSRMADGMDTREIFRLAEAGDAAMNAVLEQYVHELVIGISSLTSALRPDLVVLGGGISNAGEPLLRRVLDHMEHQCPSIPRKDFTPIVLAHLGNMAGMIGGAMMAQSIFEKVQR